MIGGEKIVIKMNISKHVMKMKFFFFIEILLLVFFEVNSSLMYRGRLRVCFVWNNCSINFKGNLQFFNELRHEQLIIERERQRCFVAELER